MPTPIVHLAYAQDYLQKRPELDAAACFRGTIFPDIRYMAGLDRDRTHLPGRVMPADIREQTDAWRVGFLLHSWVDDAWNGYMGRYGLVMGEVSKELTWATLKLYEEGFARNRLFDSDKVAAVLAEADPAIHEFGVADKIARLWGGFVATELRSGWMTESWDEFARDALGLDAQHRQSVRSGLEQLRAEGVWEERLEQCYLALQNELTA